MTLYVRTYSRHSCIGVLHCFIVLLYSTVIEDIMISIADSGTLASLKELPKSVLLSILIGSRGDEGSDLQRESKRYRDGLNIMSFSVSNVVNNGSQGWVGQYGTTSTPLAF